MGELRRAARLLHGDAHAYDDLIEELACAWAVIDEAELDDGRPLPEELDDA